MISQLLEKRNMTKESVKCKILALFPTVCKKNVHSNLHFSVIFNFRCWARRRLRDSQRERHASCSTKRAKTHEKKYQDGQLDKSLSAQAARHSWGPWSDTFLIAARSFAWKQFGYRLRWLRWHSGRTRGKGIHEVIHGTPWAPRVTTDRVCVCTRVRVYAGPWHGAQLGGPIPLTRSQHPSLAIIPFGGSLAKDLIKYCYTRNLIPLGYVPSPVSARYSLPLTPAPVSPSCRRTAQECAIRRATR